MGMHVGPLVGAVLGVERLTFDVLGDTVNTASRLASTGSAGTVSLSEESFTQVREVVVSEVTPTIRQMKGKDPTPAWALRLVDCDSGL